ncbi:MAG: SpoIIE family protein phosphatase [Bacteroidia bacterium]|nr:SpoIIE family protein phosphatase [Bacteroidia bacterium]
MKRLFIFSLWILSHSVFAQTNAECERLLNTAQDVYASNPDSSYQLSVEAERIATQVNDRNSLALANAYIGRYFLLKSELEESNQKLLLAQSYYRESDDKKGLAYVLKLRSILLDRIGNPTESLTMLEEAISMYRSVNDTAGITASLLNVTLDYIESREFEKAEAALSEIAQLKPSAVNTFYLHQNRGSLLIAQKKYQEAVKELQLAHEISISNKMIDSEATVLKLIGTAHFLNNDLFAAEEALLSSKAISEKNNLDHELVEAYEELIKLYEAQGKYKESFSFLKQQNEIKNKILNIEKINRISFLEKKLAVSEKEKEVQSARSKTQKLIYVVIGIAILLLLSIYMFLKTRSLKNKISLQHNKLEEKNIIIEEKNKDITDSIHYAKRIQEAMMPDQEQLAQILPNSFVFYKPKDIVSGDFYWMERFGKQTFVAAVDCTGHGVPGAFMSIVGSNLLNQAVNEHGITQPAAILNSIRKNLIKKLRKGNDDSTIKDGMDASLIAIHEEERTIEFAGAYNPLWLIRNGELMEIKADKTPIGINVYDQEKPFTNHKIDLQKGDMIYLFSDGFADQFGGEHGKKYKYKQLQNKLVSIHNLSLNGQQSELDSEFNSWKGELEQVDDVLIIGIRF